MAKSAYASPSFFERTPEAASAVTYACLAVLPVPLMMIANYAMPLGIGCGTLLAGARVLATGPRDSANILCLVIVPWASGLIENRSGGISVRREARNVNGVNTRAMM